MVVTLTQLREIGSRGNAAAAAVSQLLLYVLCCSPLTIETSSIATSRHVTRSPVTMPFLDFVLKI
jgi:hypothetical protein